MWLRRFRAPFVWFLAVVLTGTAGYVVIEGWPLLDALWMVVITLTTIGYGEVQPLSALGRVFTMGLIFVGLGLGTYTIGQATRYLVEGDFLGELEARKRRRIMNDLRDHLIVVGFGRLGREVAAELLHRGQRVVVIEPSPEAGAQTTAAIVPTLVISGDGTDDGVLEQAAIGQARSIAVATGSDATNVFITLTARQMNPHVHIVTRVDDARTVDKAIRAGADTVVNPYGISGARMAQGLLHPHAAQLLDQAVGRSHEEFEIEDVEIGDIPGYQGSLGELDIPTRHGILILAVRTSDGHLRTSLDRHTEIRPGDIAVVVGRPAKVRAFARAARGLPATER